jgi:hypothetical protein
MYGKCLYYVLLIKYVGTSCLFIASRFFTCYTVLLCLIDHSCYMYLYIPLSVSQRKLLSIWVVFTFVAMWHDPEWWLLHNPVADMIAYSVATSCLFFSYSSYLF